MAARGKPARKQRPAAIFYGRGLPQDLNGSEVKWNYIHCSGYDIDPETGERQYHHFTGKKCKCPMGPQGLALLSKARETAAGGGRGSAKSEVGFVFVVRGNRDEDQTVPHNQSYINHPEYRFLVLRKTADDLRTWWLRAKKFFGTMNAEFTEAPYTIRFPSGATGWASHLQDGDSWEKYQGDNLHTIWLEEATQIASGDVYIRLQGSLRTTYPELRPRIFLTANPGGPGNGWFRERFWLLKTAEGKPIRRGEIWTSPESGLTRTFIHSKVDDNPYFLKNNPEYVEYLKHELKGTKRRQWYEGDFDAFEGQYFDTYNQEKCVVPHGSIVVKPWYYRWMGMDYGTRHATVIYSAALLPSGQVYIYDELVMKGLSPRQIGESIGLAKREEFRAMPAATVPLYMPPEIIGGGRMMSETGRSIGDQIADGMMQVLGQRSVLMPDGENASEWMREQQLQKSSAILVRHAFNKRVEGWRYMADMMRWEATKAEEGFAPDFGYAASLITSGRQDEYNEYMKQVRPPVALPRMLISSKCHLLQEAIPTAVYVGEEKAKSKGLASEDVLKVNTDADDALDAARYTINAHRQMEAAEPYDDFRERRLEEILQQYPQAQSNGQAIWINRHLEKEYDKKHAPKAAMWVRGPGGRPRVPVN